MKGLRKYLSPFAPDQSGAASVLYALGGILVICDAGGCTGNICGFDEPRWQTEKSAIFSAGLRDMDAILGRDDRLVAKLRLAASQLDARFAAIIGTPVPAVIGTDYKALRRLAEKAVGLPVLTVDATGMGLYDEGAEKAYLALYETFAKDGVSPEHGTLGVLGATPLDAAGPALAARLRGALAARGWKKLLLCGLDGTLDDAILAGTAERNLVVSPAGLAAADYLKEKFGTPYTVDFPVEALDRALPETDAKKILIVHQQVLANAIRADLQAKTGAEIDVATWFRLAPSLAAPGDTALAEEDSFEALVYDGQYDLVIADPLMRRALPHYAVSGGLGQTP